MEKSILERFGFKYNKRSVHTGRTIMLEELSNLLEAVPDAIVYDDYIKAIIDRSSSSRTITANFLTELYSLDPTISIFRNLLFFWNLRIPEHPDGDSGNIRTRNRRYPDTLPANLIVK